MIKKIRIGPHTVSITRKRPKGVGLSKRAVGGYCVGQDLIFVGDDQTESQQKDTLLHEILHAVIETTALNKVIDFELEEQIVAALAPTLLDTLKRNKNLIKYLTGE